MSNIKVVKEIARIPNGSDNDEIRISVVTIEDNKNSKKCWLDIRKWTKSEKYEGPTKSGIWLTWDIVQTMVNEKIIEKGYEAMDEFAAPKID